MVAAWVKLGQMPAAVALLTAWPGPASGLEVVPSFRGSPGHIQLHTIVSLTLSAANPVSSINTKPFVW